MSAPRPSGVELPENTTGTSFFHELLLHAARRFPELASAVPESASRFRDSYALVVPRFEAARQAHPERVAIAREIRAEVARRMRWVAGGDASSLWSAVGAGEPYRWQTTRTTGTGVWTPAVEHPDGTLAGSALTAWLAERRASHHITLEAAGAFERLIARAAGGLSLAGERFVVLGAGAELSPVATLLAAGAEVLWIDVRPPPADLLARTDLGGILHVPDGSGDLLVATDRIAATVRAFAQAGAPVHLGLYAYAGGAGREWRLCEAMNAIVASMPSASVRSVSMLVSPTTAVRASAEDVAVSESRRSAAGARLRALASLGALKEWATQVGDVVVPHALVPLQGAGYQAAQYVGKVLAAESLVNAPWSLSANVAPITATRSLTHPLFEAGFLAAPDIGVLISPASATRTAQALLMVAAVTDPACVGNVERRWPTPEARAAALATEQFHGGVFNQPFGLDGLISMSAVIGLGRKPSLLWKLVRGRG